MIKYILVPSEQVQEVGAEGRTRTVTKPKYMDSLKINWAGTHIESENMYAIMVNTADMVKMLELTSKLDVIDMDGTKKAKDAVSAKLKLSKIKFNEDEFEKAGKMQEPDFLKSKIYVESD